MPLTIRIQKHDFELPVRYHERHVCDSNDAAMLNQLYAENIRNNVSNMVVREINSTPGRVLSEAQHNRLQTSITEYAHRYHFRVRSRERPPTPLDAIISELAMDQALIECHQAGVSPSDINEIRRRFYTILGSIGLADRAREVLQDREAQANKNLKGIMPDDSQK
jgi:hypothetical protein